MAVRLGQPQSRGSRLVVTTSCVGVRIAAPFDRFTADSPPKCAGEKSDDGGGHDGDDGDDDDDDDVVDDDDDDAYDDDDDRVNK